MIKQYLSLTKPGIIMGNAITATAGFLLASRGHFDPMLFSAMIVGLSLIVASGCVLNNYFDRDIDALMERTRGRALVKGTVATRNAIAFSIVLGIIGALVLLLFTNPLTLAAALFGLVVYVGVYTLWYKRHSVKSTLVGSFAGAVPPVVGYTAVSHQLDTVAIILFMVLVLWQMPHFFAIALYRLDDYIAAKIPVLPVKRSVFATKIQMLLYINAFFVAVLMLTALNRTGYIYALIMSLLCLAWIALSIVGFAATDTRKWARKMFFYSLALIVSFCILIAIDMM